MNIGILNKKSHSSPAHVFMLVLAALIWGTTFVAQSMGAEHVGAFTYLCLRSVVGCLFLIPVIAAFDRLGGRGSSKATKNVDVRSSESGLQDCRASGSDEAPKEVGAERHFWGFSRELVSAGFICGAFLFIASAFQQMGIGRTTTAKAGFITALYVVLVPVLSIFAGKKVGLKLWFCMALSVAGLYLLCMNGEEGLGFGDILMLACALFFALQILAVGKFAGGLDGVRLSFCQFFITAILSGIAMLVFERPTVSAITAAAPAILYAGIFSSGIAFTLQIVGQKRVEPTVASLAMCLESVFSALSGFFVLHQTLSPKEALGCALMFASTIISQVEKPKRQIGG